MVEANIPVSRSAELRNPAAAKRCLDRMGRMSEENRSNLDQAREILSQPSCSEAAGRDAAAMITQGRDVQSLSMREAELLARACNVAGDMQGAYAAALRAVSLVDSPNDELLSQLAMTMHQALGPGDALQEECDRLIQQGVGFAAFWHLFKADDYVYRATGAHEIPIPIDYDPDQPLAYPEFIEPAAREIEAAIKSCPDLFERHPLCTHGWDDNYAPVVGDERFGHLSEHQLRGK